MVSQNQSTFVKKEYHMLKLIVTALLVYFLYRTFFTKPSIGSPREEERNIDTPVEEDEGEYIDYEEVD